MVELVPNRTRCTVLSVGYNLDLAILGGATPMAAVGSFDPDHDAVMRIGGETPGGGALLSVGIKCQVRIRLPAPSDLNSAVVLKSQCECRMVLRAMSRKSGRSQRRIG